MPPSTSLFARRDYGAKTSLIVAAIVMTIAVLPRLSPLVGNFLFFDDYLPFGVNHLVTRRFTQAGETWLWASLFGRDYVRTILPKVASFIYVSFGIVLFMEVLRKWRIRWPVAAMATLIFVAHPILTGYLVWNTLSPANLCWVLILAGYLVQMSGGLPRLALGSALAFVGIGAYQIAIGLPLMLVALEINAGALSGTLGQASWGRRAVFIAAPIICYGIYIMVTNGGPLSPGPIVGDSRHIMTLAELLSPALLGGRLGQASAGYLNVFQPLLGFYFGPDIAWRYGWRLWALIVFGLIAITATARRGFAMTMAAIAALALAIIAPSSFQWLVSSSSLDWRVAIGMLMVLSFGLALAVEALAGRCHGTGMAIALMTAGLLFVAAMLPVTATDAELRKLGSDQTQAVVRFLKQGNLAGRPFVPVSIARPAIDAEDAILLSFGRVTCATYSLAGFSSLLPELAQTSGLTIAQSTSPEDGWRLAQLCLAHRAESRCRSLPLTSERSDTSVLCLYNK